MPRSPRLKGDRRDEFPIGRRMGPDAHDCIVEVTSVDYSQSENLTTVTLRELELDDRRLRFSGSADDT